jgi:hypothetical protein
LKQVTGAREIKQQAALVRSLRTAPRTLHLQPGTVQAKAAALSEQLLQQLSVDPVQTQQLISRHPRVLEFQADSLVQKATDQGQLLDLKAADVVVRLWTCHELITISTQLLDERLAQLRLLLQPYMSLADVQQLVQSQPKIAAGSAPETVGLRLKALQECLTDWSPQQLGAALLTYPNVLTYSPETIRQKRRIVTQYRNMYMLGTQKQQGQQQQQQQQQQEQPPVTSELALFQWPAERYALLEYIMMQQQQQQQQQQPNSRVNSTGSSVSNSSGGFESCEDGGAAHSGHVPPTLTVLYTRKHLFDRLLQEHYPDFRQWHQQRQQAAKKQGQQPE